MTQRISLRVNGRVQAIDVDPDMPLLYALRDDLGLSNPHFGCGLAQCGACTVHVDGEAVRSCSLPVSEVKGVVTTLEGLGTAADLHPVQKAFIDEQAMQCGFCVNGVLMTAKAFLDKTPRPAAPQLRQALSNVLCRCGAHTRMMRAIQRYASEVKR